jgi:predicted N-acetyltransferase YhbS
MSSGTRPRAVKQTNGFAARAVVDSSELSFSRRGVAPAPDIDAAAGASRSAPAESADRSFPLVENAGQGDHALIYELLRSVFHGPSESEFHAQLDHPRYRPVQRLVVRHDRAPAAHARLCPRELKFGGLPLPAVWLADVATLPEFRGQGYATALLRAAEAEALRDSALVLMLRTSSAAFYQRRGWVVCGGHCYSTAPPRNILAAISSLPALRRLPAIEAVEQRPRDKLHVRLWRHVEQDELMRLYDAATASAFGPLVRGDAYWRWLLSRRGYDRIYVAAESESSRDAAAVEQIVGYAVMLRGRVVELMTDCTRDDVRHALLARACGDAIERDDHAVRYDGPPGDPLHAFLAQAGGAACRRAADAGDVFMARLPSPSGFVRSIALVLSERARLAGLPRPLELGLLVDGARWSLLVSRRSARLVPGRLGRSYLRCRAADFAQLLLGHLDVAAELARQRFTASTRVAAEFAAALFPRLPLWYPPLDDLPA